MLYYQPVLQVPVLCTTKKATVKGNLEKKQGYSFQFWVAMTALLVFAVFSVVSFSTNIFLAKAATAPSIITYQGKILNNGSAVTSTQSMKFLIYDSLAGGTLLYTASGTLGATQAISVTPSSGIFSVNLGGTGTNAVTTSIFADDNSVYLEVIVGGETLSPRKRFTSAPFALNSAYLMGYSASVTSTETYIPVSDTNGNFAFNGTSQGAGVEQGLIYINPPAANENDTLFGIALGDLAKFQVDAEGDVIAQGEITAPTGTFSRSLTVDTDTFVVDGANDRVGINTSSPQYNFSVSGTAYFDEGRVTINGNRANLTFADDLQDGDGGALLNGAESVQIYGNYAFVDAQLDDAINIIDISDPENLQQVNSISYDATVGVTGFALSGNYLYMSNPEESSTDVYDISNIDNISRVGRLVDASYPVMKVQGNYLYGVYQALGAGGFVVLDITDPVTPKKVSQIDHNAGGVVVLSNPNDIVIDGSYAYIASTNGDAVQGLAISDPSNPTHVSVVTHGVGGFILDGVGAMAKRDQYLYALSVSSNTLQVIDISNPETPTDAGSYTDALATQMSGPYDIEVVDRYAYISAVFSDSIQVLDVSDPSAITVADTLFDGLTLNLSGVRQISVQGNYLYAASFGDDALHSIDLSGLKVSNAQLGSTKVEDIDVLGEAKFNRSVDIRGGLRIGSNGLLINGDLGIQAHTTTTIATNTLTFSHTALFSSAAHASSTHAFIFNTENSLPVTSTVYLLSLRNNDTPVFSVATNGDVHATGTYFGEAVAVTAPGAPGDLAEQVDIRPGELVEAGDVMIVDIEGDDRYTKSTHANAQTIAGVISTRPTITLGSGRTDHTAVMALVGRVPIKVSNQNGVVQRGDLLVSADLPGHAMKYVPSGIGAARAAIIGTALENQDPAEPTGKIMGLVRSGWAGGSSSGGGNTFSGSSLLSKGQVFVEFTPEQQAMIGPNDNFRVQVTLNGQANGVYVPNKWRTGFQVKETFDSGSNAAFDWQVEIISAQDGPGMQEPPDGPAPQPVAEPAPQPDPEPEPVQEEQPNPVQEEENQEPVQEQAPEQQPDEEEVLNQEEQNFVPEPENEPAPEGLQEE